MPLDPDDIRTPPESKPELGEAEDIEERDPEPASAPVEAKPPVTLICTSSK